MNVKKKTEKGLVLVVDGIPVAEWNAGAQGGDSAWATAGSEGVPPPHHAVSYTHTIPFHHHQIFFLFNLFLKIK
jgi:hypothetical protein